jgi:hypothetical protein
MLQGTPAPVNMAVASQLGASTPPARLGSLAVAGAWATAHHRLAVRDSQPGAGKRPSADLGLRALSCGA